MNPLEQLAQRPRLRMGAGVAFVALAVGFVFLQARGRSVSTADNPNAFFSVDDGRTWFTDAATHVPPFDKDGKQAVRAFVFRPADGAAFVGYLQRFTPEAKRTLEQYQTRGSNGQGSADPTALHLAYTVGREVKRPGDAEWVSGAQPVKAVQAMAVKPPNGGLADPVEP